MSTLLVATTGGHLTQLADLVDRFDPVPDDRFWITNRSPQSESMLDGEDVIWVSEVESRDYVGVARSVASAHRVLRERRVTDAISTGSGIALGYLPYLAVRGVDCHFIESAARVEGPSLSGRILSRTPKVHLYTQYPGNVTKSWHYRGSVFDGFESTSMPIPPPIERVLVTVGTITEQFTSLIESLVPLLGPGGAIERHQGVAPTVTWQTGHTDVARFPIAPTPFVAPAALEALIDESTLVISHAGVGSALTALRRGRCPVLVPRRAARLEIVDDHQLQVADELDSRSLAIRAEVDELALDTLLRAATREVRPRTGTLPFCLDHP